MRAVFRFFRLATLSAATLAALAACGGHKLDVGSDRDDTSSTTSSELRCASGAPVSLPRVSVGTGHACAILDDLSLACWGFNDGGQLGLSPDKSEHRVEGDHTYAYALAPQRVAGLPADGVAQVSAGWETTCALTCGGEVWCWGDNSMGVLGATEPHASSAPVRIAALGADVVEVRSGGGPACARKKDGSVWCWGETTYGNTGVAAPPDANVWPIAPPTRVADVHDAVEIAVSDTVSCARDASAHVSCWGAVQLDPTGYMPASEKVRPIPGVEHAKQIALAQSSAFVLSEEGSVWAWGDQRGAQSRSALAIVSTYDYVAPTLVPSLRDIVALSANDGTACALGADASVVCWGDNSQGQLGRGTIGSEAWGAPAAVPIKKSKSVAVGTWSACAETEDRAILCWGSSDFGALGTGRDDREIAKPGDPVVLPRTTK